MSDAFANAAVQSIVSASKKFDIRDFVAVLRS